MQAESSKVVVVVEETQSLKEVVVVEDTESLKEVVVEEKLMKHKMKRFINRFIMNMTLNFMKMAMVKDFLLRNKNGNSN